MAKARRAAAGQRGEGQGEGVEQQEYTHQQQATTLAPPAGRAPIR
jgi:hypothetical protein